ncbi:hypothetical protein AGR8A_Lc20159 [Agrobacterium fabrum str. J-07]|nr:hypothetical protein AGR8A_Lc20159 [Agrobacterium fabrum str. J-07]
MPEPSVKAVAVPANKTEEGTLLLLPTENASDDRSFMALKLNDAGTGCSAMVHVAFVFSCPLDAAHDHSHFIHAVARTGPRKCPAIARMGCRT